jgi:hypothetical protein
MGSIIGITIFFVDIWAMSSPLRYNFINQPNEKKQETSWCTT